jgi:Uma2 family endonuclease
MLTLPRSLSLTPDQFAQVCAANPAAVLGPNRRRLDRSRTLSEAEREGFPPLCPDLVVELASPSDQLEPLRQKMAWYVSNGARLGWLSHHQTMVNSIPVP